MPKRVFLDKELHNKAQAIKLLVLDVDGVLTDGKLYFNNDGVEQKAFNTLDGHGIKMLRQSGVEVGIITGRTSRLVERRAKDLGIHLLIQGREDKYTALQEMLAQFKCTLSEIAFMGDDWPDLTVMTRAGLALSVASAHWQVIELAHWVSEKKGGEGAVRDACDLIMLAQNTYQQALKPYADIQV